LEKQRVESSGTARIYLLNRQNHPCTIPEPTKIRLTTVQWGYHPLPRHRSLHPTAIHPNAPKRTHKSTKQQIGIFFCAEGESFGNPQHLYKLRSVQEQKQKQGSKTAKQLNRNKRNNF
jgi:hypothetical protein